MRKAKPGISGTVPLTPTEFEILVIVSDSATEVRRLLTLHVGRKFANKYHKEMNTYSNATNEVVEVQYGDYTEMKFLLVLRGFNPGAIAHDAVHITRKLGKIVGFNYDGCEETEAYYVGHIVNSVLALREN